jgi:hypothetical protein
VTTWDVYALTAGDVGVADQAKRPAMLPMESSPTTPAATAALTKEPPSDFLKKSWIMGAERWSFPATRILFSGGSVGFISAAVSPAQPGLARLDRTPWPVKAVRPHRHQPNGAKA